MHCSSRLKEALILAVFSLSLLTSAATAMNQTNGALQNFSELICTKHTRAPASSTVNRSESRQRKAGRAKLQLRSGPLWPVRHFFRQPRCCCLPSRLEERLCSD